MRQPRALSGPDRICRLERLGDAVTRQSGSRLPLTSQTGGERPVAVPNHSYLRLGTLSANLAVVAAHHGMTRDEQLARLLD